MLGVAWSVKDGGIGGVLFSEETSREWPAHAWEAIKAAWRSLPDADVPAEVPAPFAVEELLEELKERPAMSVFRREFCFEGPSKR